MASIAKENIPKTAAVKPISCALNSPAPRISSIIGRLKIKSIKENGTPKNIILRMASEKSRLKESESFFEKEDDRTGKAATAIEMPIIEIGKYWRLLAKLKIEILPTVMVDAIAVIAIKFIWLTARPRVLGSINFEIFFKPTSVKSIMP